MEESPSDWCIRSNHTGLTAVNGPAIGNLECPFGGQWA